MRRMLAISIVTMIASAPMAASAQERAGDAALGAVSGALVFGPVGAVAGALVGYAAGPSIARSWGLKRSEPRPLKSQARRITPPATKTRAPTQDARASSASTQAAATSPAPPAPHPAQARDARNAMPPAQTLE
ncbi:MAG: hypothetical protein ACJ8DX_03745 [Xanthobacteraceae bacterium]